MLYAHYRSQWVVWIASITLLIAFIAVMTVQFIGGARLLETVVGIPYTQGTINLWGDYRVIHLTRRF